MKTRLVGALNRLRRIARDGDGTLVTDRELLDRFVQSRDEAAFDAVVHRHGSMVLSVCKRTLHNPELAEDAFQAVFLVLVKKAGSLRWRESIGSWLYEVAYRVCAKANVAEARRREREQRAAELGKAMNQEHRGDEGCELLDALFRLPERYRSPLVLCYLEGKSSEEAASELGLGTSAVKMRVARGRAKLRRQLEKQGVVLNVAVVQTLLDGQSAQAMTVSPGLARSTIRNAFDFAAGKGYTSASAWVPQLVEGVMQDMFTRNLRRACVACLAVAMLAVGFGTLGHSLLGRAEGNPGPDPLKLTSVTKEETQQVVAGNTRFTTDLYGELRSTKGNLFFSPYSISTALAMSYAGAQGDTEAQMAKALHFALPQEKLHTGFADLIQEINGDGKDRGYTLATANRLWAQRGFTFRPDYVNITENQYGAGVEEVDFVADPAKAVKTINQWVEKATKDKIKDLLKADDVNSDVRAVLTNAIYFKGDWKAQFDKKKTDTEKFHLTKDVSKDVSMMHLEHKFKFRSAGDMQVLEMPYKNDHLSMVIYLPEKVDGLADFEKNLTAEKLTSLFPNHKEKVMVHLPKFKYTAEFCLNDALQALGMQDAFSPKVANFSRMRSENDLFISRVVHKAFVDVNEEGTEAAAATGVIKTLKSAPVLQQFRADHPFLFVIKDNKTNSILFMGRVVDPSAS